MKQIQRGRPGYMTQAKRNELLKTILMFAIVLALLITGIVTTGTRMNLLTVVAVLGCLPAARYCVNFIARAPYSSLSPQRVKEIKEHAGDVPVYYELLVGSKEKNRFVDCIAISGHAVCGLVTHPKSNRAEAESRLRAVCKENGFQQVTVKLFDREQDFFRRLDEMEQHYDSDEQERRFERSLGHTLTLTCL